MFCDAPTHAKSGCACLSRRAALLMLAGAGLGIAMPAIAAPKRTRIDTLVLTCADDAEADGALRYLDATDLAGKYDRLALAGGSAGALGTMGADESDEFWKRVGAARRTQGIYRIVVMDHRGCGAYRKIFGDAALATPELETALHIQQSILLTNAINQKFPDFDTEMLLIDPTGHVDVLTRSEDADPLVRRNSSRFIF